MRRDPPGARGRGLAYVMLTLSYTMIWRRIPVLDVVAVAGGFVLRALAGGVAPPIRLSVWFVLVVSSAAAPPRRLARIAVGRS